MTTYPRTPADERAELRESRAWDAASSCCGFADYHVGEQQAYRAATTDPSFWPLPEPERTGSRNMVGRIAVALVLAAVLLFTGLAIAGATPTTPGPDDEVEVFWSMPDGGTEQSVTWPQTYSPGGAVECGVWYQVDRYRFKDVEALIADGLLHNGEDHSVVISWRFAYGGDCATEPPTTEPPTETPTEPEPTTEPPTTPPTDEPTEQEPTTPPVTEPPTETPTEPEPTTPPATEPPTAPEPTTPVDEPTTTPPAEPTPEPSSPEPSTPAEPTPDIGTPTSSERPIITPDVPVQAQSEQLPETGIRELGLTALGALVLIGVGVAVLRRSRQMGAQR